MMGMAAGFALALAAGCGSSVETGTGGNGGGTSSTGTGGSGGACSAFKDQQGQGSVTVIFRNDTAQPVYLPSSCTTPNYLIEPEGGPDGLAYTFEGSCLETCEALQTQGQWACGACPEQTYRIEPGQTLQQTWNGTGLKGNVVMPNACWWQGSAGPGGGTCSQIVAAAPGMYVASATGFAECTGPCTCDANGVCEGTASGLQATADPASFSFPDASTVEVVFNVCAFGCPDSP